MDSFEKKRSSSTANLRLSGPIPFSSWDHQLLVSRRIDLRGSGNRIIVHSSPFWLHFWPSRTGRYTLLNALHSRYHDYCRHRSHALGVSSSVALCAHKREVGLLYL